MKRVMLAMVAVAVAFAGGDSKVVSRPDVQRPPEERIETPPPPFSEGIYPCSGCHAAMKPNRTRRTLSDMHTDIILKHDAEHRWCLDCHDAGEPRLAAPGQRREAPVRGVVPALRTVPRRETARLEGRSPRPARWKLERLQGLPSLCPLP